MTSGEVAAGAPQEGALVDRAEQQVILGRQHFDDDTWRQFEADAWQQFPACPEFVAATVWQVGAGVLLVAATVWQVVCWVWQHTIVVALQALIFAGLQLSLASAAPPNAARTAMVTLSATNFHRLRLMLSPFQL